MRDTLIIGISTVDAIARPVDEFPGPGGLLFFEHLAFTTGGCAVNCAIAMAKLGVATDVITRVGRDLLGGFVKSELSRCGVGVDGVVEDAARSTPFTFAAVGSDGERRFLHTTGSNATLASTDVPASTLEGRRIVFVTGTMLMDTFDGEQAASVLAAARTAGALTLHDTVFVESAAPEEWRRRVWPTLPHLDYFVPSHAEATALAGDDDPSRAAQAFQAAGARQVVIKLGAEGALCRAADGAETVVPAFPVARVVDTTGAGDCWCAGFIHALRDGADMPAAARLGNAVAALGIQAAGASAGVPTIDEVRALLEG